MLWTESLAASLSAIFLLLLVLSRSPVFSAVALAGLYCLLALFRFEPVPASRALQVLKPKGRVSVIAHRGGGHDAPENTLAAIRQAAINGATGVEIDLQFTADGVPILMHDCKVDRTTDGFGSLQRFTYAELSRLNPAANHRLKHKFRNEKIPTLREAVLECIKNNLTIYFDVKGNAEEMRQADVNVVTGLTHRPWSLSHFGDGKPYYSSVGKHYWYMLMDILLDWSLNNILWNLCGISAFLMQKNFISPEFVRQWNARDVEVVAWTVNSASAKSYFESVLHSSYITDSLVEDCDPFY
ncbi:glycerophosphodiester phosphodiesterase 1 isoform X2 [Rhinatrema bivittatum]|uniref:glycerophosphodiester phosphodiesterase 1 isoform X2 n=1 Tax=Rhinatrema bivittatum TaxID=194408 RepID=UPI001126A33C|nr:glycerophosphodiester phosphodiesterase 1 isoform X2 [Rhinatrema bivittatum]